MAARRFFVKTESKDFDGGREVPLAISSNISTIGATPPNFDPPAKNNVAAARIVQNPKNDVHTFSWPRNLA